MMHGKEIRLLSVQTATDSGWITQSGWSSGPDSSKTGLEDLHKTAGFDAGAALQWLGKDTEY